MLPDVNFKDEDTRWFIKQGAKWLAIMLAVYGVAIGAYWMFD